MGGLGLIAADTGHRGTTVPPFLSPRHTQSLPYTALLRKSLSYIFTEPQASATQNSGWRETYEQLSEVLLALGRWQSTQVRRQLPAGRGAPPGR